VKSKTFVLVLSCVLKH